MGATAGLSVIGDYTTGSPTNKVTVSRLTALIANPDVPPAQAGKAGSGSTGGRGFLDEMSPAAAAQLRVELAALEAAIENV